LNREIKRADVWEISLDPSKGSEQAGFRPCVIISPDSMNDQLETVIVLPLTTKRKDWPTRVDTFFEGTSGQAMCEQIRTISKKRLKSHLGRLSINETVEIKLVLKQMLFD
jgi:mRNA interferase MazF